MNLRRVILKFATRIIAEQILCWGIHLSVNLLNPPEAVYFLLLNSLADTREDVREMAATSPISFISMKFLPNNGLAPPVKDILDPPLQFFNIANSPQVTDGWQLKVSILLTLLKCVGEKRWHLKTATCTQLSLKAHHWEKSPTPPPRPQFFFRSLFPFNLRLQNDSVN